MKTSVIIPTLRRPVALIRCLSALQQQDQPADEVLVAVRSDDEETLAALAVARWDGLPLQLVHIRPVNASEARNECLRRSTGEIIVLIDDDTIPRPGFIARIRAHFDRTPGLGGLGGPDWIGGETVPMSERPDRVGIIQWFGRQVGNHHLGSRAPMAVEWLKGANMSFRREALLPDGFGRGLRGSGAQFGEDLAATLMVRRAGWDLLYDPEVAVDHFPGELTAGVDHRRLADDASLADAAHNETVLLLSYLPPVRRLVFFAYAVLLGTHLLPGPVMGLHHLVTHRKTDLLTRSAVVVRARFAGWRTWREVRRGPAVRGPRAESHARPYGVTR